MIQDLQQHYRRLFEAHGDAAQAVQHHDATSQENRFRVLAAVAPELGSVVDLGCGLGHLCDYLRRQGFQGRYLGLDFVPEFIEHAARRHAGDANAEFRVFDLGEGQYPAGYDTYLACGIFNNAMPGNPEFLRSTLDKAWAAAGRRLAFNALSTYVDWQDPTLFYTDPLALFDHCKRALTGRAALRHDYLVRDDRLPYEFTLYLYR